MPQLRVEIGGRLMDLTPFGLFIDRYGLPVFFLLILGYALWRRILILGSEKERSDAVFDRELQYREDRRLEERQGRIRAEGALTSLTRSFSELASSIEELVGDISDEAPRSPPEVRRGTRR
jgi:hypothetical protein